MPKEKWFVPIILRREGLTVRHRNTSIPGTWAVEAVWNFSPTPVGTLWFLWAGKSTIMITDIYIPKLYRRLGVATWILNSILKDYPVIRTITTETANELSKPWLKKLFFKHSEQDGWVLKLAICPKKKGKKCRKQ